MILLWAAAGAAAPPPPRQGTYDQPGDVMPSRDWDFVHLDLDLEIDPRDPTVAGRATWTVRPLGAPSSTLFLHQVGLQISAVTLDETPIPDWTLSAEQIRIDLPEGTGGPFEVAITYEATPQTGLHVRGGERSPPTEIHEIWSQGEGQDNRHWYPGWDYPNDKFTVRTHLTVPAAYVAVANGVLEDRQVQPDGTTRWTYHMARPIVNYLVAVAVGDYEVYPLDGPVHSEAVVPRGTGALAAHRTFDRAGSQIDFFADLLGEPFPYDAYRHVVAQRFLYGGMENAALTIYNDNRLLFDDTNPTDPTDTTVAHEAAHQWFGDLLTCYGWREMWLNEGFATYYAARWQEHDQGPARFAEVVRGWHQRASYTQPMAARGHSKVGDSDSQSVYTRGGAVLHQLSVFLGRDTFDAGIRRYVEANRDRLVETEDLRRALEDVSGRHLGWLFDQWVTGVGNAAVSSHVTHSENQLEVVFEQTAPDPFFVPVEVAVAWSSGEVTSHEVWIHGGETRLVIPMDAPPAYVAIDPRGGTLVDWDHTQAPEAWARQAVDAQEPHAQLVAIEALGRAPSAVPPVPTLASLLEDPEAPRAIRMAAAAALGETMSRSATSVLERTLTDPDPQVRVAAATALGTSGGAEAVDALSRAIRRDDAAQVRGAALLALAELDPTAGRATARSLLGRADPSPRHHMIDAATKVLGAHGAPRDLDRLLAQLDEDRYSATRIRGSAKAAIALVEGLDDSEDARTRVALRIAPLLDSSFIVLRRRAIRWLGRLGVASSTDALVRFAKNNQVAGLSDAALGASIRRFEGHSAPAKGFETEDLDALREALTALEDRIEDLETFR